MYIGNVWHLRTQGEDEECLDEWEFFKFVIVWQELLNSVIRIIDVDLTPKEIPSKLYLDMVPSSSEDVTHAMKTALTKKRSEFAVFQLQKDSLYTF